MILRRAQLEAAALAMARADYGSHEREGPAGKVYITRPGGEYEELPLRAWEELTDEVRERFIGPMRAHLKVALPHLGLELEPPCNHEHSNWEQLESGGFRCEDCGELV